MLDEASHVVAAPAHPAVFGRILVAIGAGDRTAALRLATTLGGPDAVFVLAHISTDHSVAGDQPDQGHPNTTEASMNLLISARRELGRPCEIVVEQAPSVAAGLHAIAEREQADLLVLSAATAPDPAHPGHGDRACGLHHALHGAPCAVAIAPTSQRPAELTRIGVGYRPTEPGQHAAAVARELAAATGAELHAMTVVPVMPNPWIGGAAATVQELARLDGTLSEIAEADLQALGDVVDHVVEGDPIHELQRFSRTVDLLVVATRSGGPLRRLISNSTADALSATAGCPLLVVSPHDGPGAAGPLR